MLMGGRRGRESRRTISRERPDRATRKPLYCSRLSCSPDDCDCGAASFRALRSAFFLLESLTICSMDRTFLGRLFLKCLEYNSSMNSGKGNFQGSCLMLAKPPNFLGFSPSSRAIWMWASERRKRRRASIHGRYFSGIFFFFATGHLFTENGPMSPNAVMRRPKSPKRESQTFRFECPHIRETANAELNEVQLPFSSVRSFASPVFFPRFDIVAIRAQARKKPLLMTPFDVVQVKSPYVRITTNLTTVPG